MKKSLFLFVFSLVAIVSSSNAQLNFSIEVPDTTLYGLSTENDFHGDIDMYNNASGKIDMTWELTSQDLPSGWEFSVCDPTECRPKGVTTANFPLVVSSSVNYINVHFYPNGKPGKGILKIKLFETADPSNHLTMTFTGVAQTATGLNETAKNVMFTQNYPNPFINSTAIDYNLGNRNVNASIRIYDALGVEVFNHRLSSNRGRANLNLKLPSGFYFYSLLNDGQVLETKRMVVTRKE